MGPHFTMKGNLSIYIRTW